MSALDYLPTPLRARLLKKRSAYAAAFLDANGHLSPAGAIVLADLKRFCAINKGGLRISPVTRMTDPYGSAYLAGQRDVYQRIIEFLRLDGADITEE